MRAAEESLRAGRLSEALTFLQADIRRAPADAGLRLFLAELLMLLGQWDRCGTQLGVAGEMDPSLAPLAALYGPAVIAEAVRRRVFAGVERPLILGEPESWIASLVQALEVAAAGRNDEAAALRDMAFEGAAAVAGRLDGVDFEWLADADPRLGPVLEAIVNGTYYWVPLQRVRRLVVRKPANLRDMSYALADFTWSNGGQMSGLIPVRYPGVEDVSDDRLRLAQLTDWLDVGTGAVIGRGQRMLATESGEFAVLDVREITLAIPT